jgi:hypothetical protein
MPRHLYQPNDVVGCNWHSPVTDLSEESAKEFWAGVDEAARD